MAGVAMGVTTFLFTDLVSSTELLSRLGETRMELLRREHFDTLRAALDATGGREVKNLGDGLMVAFASPSDSVACAVAMQRAVERANRRSPEPLAIRIGIDVGETTEDGADFFGGPVVEAKRLCDAAAGGQILVSEVVRALAAPRSPHRFESVGSLTLKGLPEPVAAYEVAWAAAPSSRIPLPPLLAAAGGPRTPFVGREEECQHLLRTWRDVVAGGWRLSLLVGEPGIGKTRLAGELARRVHDDGAVVLWGRSSDDAGVPYEPFVEALRHYVASSPADELREQAAAVAPVLSRVVPEVLERLPGVEPAAPDEAETERLRLFDAVSALLSELSASAPVLLVLDDLQWADQATLLLLKHVVRSTRPGSVLALATCRETELAQADALLQVVADLHRERLLDRIRLGGLDGDDVATLLDALAGWSPPAGFADALFEETRGNPLFVEEVVRHLQDTGVLTHEDDRAPTRLDIEEAGVPEGVKEVLGRRFRRLSAPALEALSAASVIGSDVTIEILAAALERDEEALVPELDEAVRAGLLLEVPGHLGRYRFAHALVEHALYDDLGRNRRAWLHARVGAAYQERYAGDPASCSAAIARHYARAGDRYAGRVVPCAIAASRSALALLAWEDAERELDLALDALERSTPDDARRRAEIQVLRGTAKFRAGDAPGARERFAEAAALAKAAEAPDLLAEAALGYGGVAGFGGLFITGGGSSVDEGLVELLDDALRAHPDSDDPMRARLLGRQAQALYWSPEKERMRALSEEALGVARRVGDAAALAHALDSRHVALWDPDHLAERERIAEEMLRLGRELGDRDIQLEARAWLITDVLERGAIGDVDAHIEAHAALAEEMHQPYYLWYTAAARAMRAHVDGRLDDMDRLMTEALTFGEHAHTANAMQTYLVQLVVLRHERGQLDDVIEGIARYVEGSPLEIGWRAGLAFASAQLDRRDQALEQLRRVMDAGPLPRDSIWAATMAFLAGAVGRLRDADRAAELAEALAPFRERLVVVGGAVLCLGPVSRLLGVLAGVLGDHAVAVAHLEDAVERSRLLGSPTFEATAQADLAAVLRERNGPGDDARAEALLAEAGRTAARLGMRALGPAAG